MKHDQVAIEQKIALASQSAYKVIQHKVRLSLLILILGIFILFFLFPVEFGIPLFVLAFFNYLVLLSFRLSNTIFYTRSSEEEIADDLLSLPENPPLVSVIVPLKKERDVIPGLVEAIENQTYPKNSLDVVIVVEKTDDYTLKTIEKISLPSYFRLLVIPEKPPFTKGRALCHAIKSIHGSYVTVFDAESRPQPNQILLAVNKLMSSTTPHCFQSVVSISNKNSNWISRNFSCEYWEWYCSHLKNLSCNKLSFGLGGNSFYLSKNDLLKALGWDPYNVTEDADLAVRLIKNGVKIRLLNSTTSETCPKDVGGWINQRTRWNKGLLITQLVHLPKLSTLKKMGFSQYVNFWLPMCAMTLLPFFNLYLPVFILFGGWSFPFFILLIFLLWGLLLFGVFCAYFMNRLVYKKLNIKASTYVILLDVCKYLLIHLVAGFKSYFEYFSSPLHWHKTPHEIPK